MASPQWKNFQPSAEDTTSYQCSPSFSKTSNIDHDIDHSKDHCTDPNAASGNLRETGIVEKLLHSYGFIQCCERQARLFFHYSQYSGNIEHLKLGDPVELEMTYDRRTGKPIASSVVRIAPEAGEMLSEERVSGFITTEIKDDVEGRVAYESRGECFFLPYAKDDLETETDLHPHDKVTFRIATDKKTGNLRARNIQLEKLHAEKFQGVICALKETFGFIERADVVKEIFFHSSECKDFKSLNIGDDVEFSIHTRNNKEVAVNITLLPVGTVVFEDIDPQMLVGQVTKVIEKERSKHLSDGKIQCQHADNTVAEYTFGERDLKSECTLQVGDYVQFNLACDRRDNLQRGTNIELMAESFTYSGEKREQGIVIAVKETFGFIKYGNRDTRLYFRLTEVMNLDILVKPQDEVEFTVSQDPVTPNRYQAIRIQVLPPGSIDIDPTPVNSNWITHEDDERNFLTGVIEKAAFAPWSSKSPQKGIKTANRQVENEDEENSFQSTKPEDGVISFYNKDAVKEKVCYSVHDCQSRGYPHTGDKVEFTLLAKGEEGSMCAVNVRIVGGKMRNGLRYTHHGFIAALKDSFGFIETEEHEREVFFHYSVYDGNASSLEVGQEVEYGLMHKGTKLSAECVRKLPTGSIPTEEIQPEVLNGVVLCPLRCFNPDQDNYSGRIRLSTDAENVEEEEQKEFEFGITSLTDKHEFLQKGDVVQFQIGNTSKGQERAMNIKSIRTRVQATVDTIKGHFGFLSYEAEEGKKLFFHVSEVKDGSLLQPGDKVEFVILHHQRTGKYSAYSVVKISESQPMQRPERLISRLRTTTAEDSGPRMIVCRHPKGPDGTNGFKLPRQMLEFETSVADVETLLLNGMAIDTPNGEEYCYVEQNGAGDGQTTVIGEPTICNQ